MDINEAVTRLFEVARAADEAGIDQQTPSGAHETHKRSRSESTEASGIPSCLPLYAALVKHAYLVVRSHGDSIEIVHEAICQVVERDDARAVSDLRAHLHNVVHKIATDRISPRVVRERFYAEDPIGADRNALLPARMLSRKEELAALKRAVGRLPPKCKMALLWVRVDGLTYEDVGERLGINTHSAMRLVERAMEYLFVGVPERDHDSPRKL